MFVLSENAMLPRTSISDKISLLDKLDILGELHCELGERKIDLLVYPDLSAPFARIAVSEGVLL